MNVPEPTTAKLVDKKTAAYEKQQAEVEEESRMKSLEQLAGTLMNNGKSSDTGEKEKDGDRLQQSVNTYEQISGQLDDFYETPKETASGDLERKVDELNKKLEEAEKEKSKAATREELMERSYRMAAKYLNLTRIRFGRKLSEKNPRKLFRFSGRSIRRLPAFHDLLRIPLLSLRSLSRGITVLILLSGAATKWGRIPSPPAFRRTRPLSREAG